MTKRRCFRFFTIAGMIFFAIWLEPTRVAWGLMSGEAFYDGRPASYWRRELGRWQFGIMHCSFFGARPSEYWLREKNELAELFDRWRDEVALDYSQPPPPILQGDVRAQTVLESLRNDPHWRVRDNAVRGLMAISTKVQRS